MNSQEVQKLGFKLVGQVGVNVGCIFIVDPSEVLNEKDYRKFMKLSEKSDDGYLEMKKGMIVPSGWGDGNYHVYVQEKKDSDGCVRVERVLIDFTSTYGYDSDNTEMHDMDVKELFDFVVKRDSNQLSKFKTNSS